MVFGSKNRLGRESRGNPGIYIFGLTGRVNLAGLVSELKNRLGMVWWIVCYGVKLNYTYQISYNINLLCWVSILNNRKSGCKYNNIIFDVTGWEGWLLQFPDGQFTLFLRASRETFQEEWAKVGLREWVPPLHCENSMCNISLHVKCWTPKGKKCKVFFSFFTFTFHEKVEDFTLNKHYLIPRLNSLQGNSLDPFKKLLFMFDAIQLSLHEERKTKREKDKETNPYRFQFSDTRHAIQALSWMSRESRTTHSPSFESIPDCGIRIGCHT